jgi:AcrR family transcriptional regulator
MSPQENAKRSTPNAQRQTLKPFLAYYVFIFTFVRLISPLKKFTNKLLMDEQLKQILSKVRMLALEKGIENISIKSICDHLGISEEILKKHIKNEKDLVRKVLEFERDSFKGIFDEYDFEGVNAIDILMVVSKEIASRFYDVTPTISVLLKEKFPNEYQEHLQHRLDFIFGKIQINLTKGISQGIYRSDLSIELIARLYMSRLIDLHNEEIFPSKQFSFSTLFEAMFENFVRSVATDEGLKYFNRKKRGVKFKK